MCDSLYGLCPYVARSHPACQPARAIARWSCAIRRSEAADDMLLDMDGADHYSDHMGKSVTATEAKAKILALLDEVESGEEIEITRHGRLVARLVPVRGGAALRGKFAGQVRQTVSDEDLMKPIDGWFTGWDWTRDEGPAES